MSAAARKYAFGPFQMDVAESLLVRDGQPVPLTSKSFDVLAVLLEHSGHLVEKRELLQRVWPDTFVEEAVLSVNIAAIRRALADDEHRYIETVPKRGYRFIGELRNPPGGTANAQEGAGFVSTTPAAATRVGLERALRRRGIRWTAVAGVVALLVMSVQVGRRALAPPPRNSVAVLPLRSLSDDPEQRHFAEAMTDLMLTALGRIPRLRVVSRQSVLQYEGTLKTLPQIARELQVDCLVEGTVQRQGQRVRITAQLIHGPSDRHLWGQSYERDLRDTLALQQEVAETIAREIGITLAPAERPREAPPVEPAVYEAYLRGVYFLDEGRAGDAVAEFRKALAADPNYGPAYTKMASSYFGRAFFGAMPPNEGFPSMKEAALRAIELNNSDAEAHASLAIEKLHYEWDWPGAEREFRRSLQLNPSDSDVRHLYAHYLLTVGRWQESLAEMDRAFETDPVGLEAAT